MILLISSMIFINEARGSHSMGADLTYKCLGGNSYEIELSFYRDCAGIEADTEAYIVFQSSCFPADSIRIYQIAGTGQEISPACPNNTTTCNGGTFTGIQEYIYRGVINLPGPCADWQFSYNLCCRNNAITNINNPGQTQIYIFANLNSTISPCNNSPTFSNKPVPFACRGQQFCYNHGAYDQDGDSLVYSLITPYEGPGTPINYSPPWTATNPLTSSPAVSLNQFTGDICMTPTNLEITVMAVLVEEYRNGVLIGAVERDIQFTIIDCNNIIPTLSGINGTNSFSQTVCAGTQTCFDITSSDVNGTQNTFIDWDYSIPGATFTTYPASRETATFCWTPTSAQISTNPYCFTVTVRDDNCPFVGSQIYAYCITVTGIIADAGPDLTVACNATTPITATASGGSGMYNYQWNTGANTPSIIGGAGTYVVTASDGSCTDSDSAVVSPAIGSPSAAFSTNSNCTSLTVQFTDQSTIVGGTIASYFWNFGDGNTSALQNPSHPYAATGDYQVQLIVTSTTGCIDTLIQTLHLSLNAADALFTLANGCIGTQVNFTNQSTSLSAINSWMWYFGDGTTSTVSDPAHIYSTSGAFNTSLVVTNVDGCRDSIMHPLTIFALPIANAGINDTICPGAIATLTASGGVSYLWNPGTLNTAAIAVSPSASTNYVVTVTDNNGCTSTAGASVLLARIPQLNAQDRTICLGSSTNISVNVSGGGWGGSYTYLWNPGALTTQQINVSPIVTTDYFVTVTTNFGCTATDTSTVTISAAIADAGSNQSICIGNSTTLSAATGGTFYNWMPGNINSQQINVTPIVNTTYTVEVTDNNGCTSTDQVNVNVNNLPNANAGIDQTICRGSSATLNASGGTRYVWTPGNDTLPQLTVSPNSNSRYIVSVTDANGCTDNDTIDIIVNTLPVIAVSSTDALCFGSTDGTAMAIASGSTPPYVYSWSPSGGAVDTAIGLASRMYYLTVIDSNNCRQVDSVFIDQPDEIIMTVNNITASCLISPTGSAAISASGGTSTLTYDWWPNGGTSSTANNLDAGYYTVTVTDINGCTRNTPVSIPLIPALAVTTITPPPLCGGYIAQLQAAGSGGAGGPYTYSWNNGEFFGDSPTVLAVSDSTFTVTLSDGCSAEVSQSVYLSVYPLPQVDFTPQAIAGCTPVEVDFRNYYPQQSGSLFYWDLDDNVLSSDTNPTHTYTAPGEYDITLMIITPDGCSETKTVTNAVTVYGFPVADFYQSADQVPEFQPTVSFTDNSTDAINWEWDFGDGTSVTGEPQPSHEYSDSGTYNIRLIVTSAGGCIDTTYGIVRVEPEFTIYVPNAFTPNGDGVNDYFFATGVNFADYEMWIMDRWGKEIFHSTEQSKQWDGSFYGNDNFCQNDVYEFIINVHDYKGKAHKVIGHVSLVR
ncbi:MAG: PKD domain-containing protein [Bacteroidetes bacterium]|nr:PKD domain-containing protein [Bacteroidota bacterium]